MWTLCTIVAPDLVGRPPSRRPAGRRCPVADRVSAMDYASFDSVLEKLRAADISTSASAMASTSELLGDKTRIRKTFVRHVVRRVERDFPGRVFSDLAILELGAGAGFFALSYAEAFPHLPLKNLMQVDKYPQDDAGVIIQHDVADLSQEDNPISTRNFDVVLSIDVLSCLAFGRGLDPDDAEDIDEMRHLDKTLARMLESGGKYYDFMACAPYAAPKRPIISVHPRECRVCMCAAQEFAVCHAVRARLCAVRRKPSFSSLHHRVR